MHQLRWYLVHGQYLMPYCMILLPTEPKTFTSPVEAYNPEDAIERVYSQMLSDWNRLTNIDGQKPEEITDEALTQMSEERINQVTLARQPINPDEWTTQKVRQSKLSRPQREMIASHLRGLSPVELTERDRTLARIPSSERTCR